MRYLKTSTFLLIAVAAMHAQAAPDSFAKSGSLPHETELHNKEVNAAKLSEQWIRTNDYPVTKDGRVLFTYGASMPTIVCSPLNLCDLALEEGELVRAVHVGDKIRWSITPALSGSENKVRTHLVIKPKTLDINTSLFIATDKRSYHLRLKSRASRFMPKVGFDYPKQLKRDDWDDYYEEKALSGEMGSVVSSELSVNKLRPEPVKNTKYKIKGKAHWRPLSVYNDGLKTYIQMPETMLSGEAPALLEVTGKANLKMVNYRIDRNVYVIDSLFRKAVLIAGVGKRQEKVTIYYKGK